LAQKFSGVLINHILDVWSF